MYYKAFYFWWTQIVPPMLFKTNYCEYCDIRRHTCHVMSCCDRLVLTPDRITAHATPRSWTLFDDISHNENNYYQSAG
jgi:hypothetical protein